MIIDSKQNKLLFSGLDIQKLAEKIPTPFFLFSENILTANYREFKKAFSGGFPKVRIDYSVKTNNELVILKVLQKLGASLEISCGHELFLARKAGFTANKISFDGPGKKDADINYALEEKIHAFYADSIDDLKEINRLAGIKKTKALVSLRINLGLKSIVNGLAENFIGKFGIPENEAIQTYYLAKKLAHLEIIGLTTHLGSQILKPKPYLKAIDKLVSLAQILEKENLIIREINLGGGFPSQTLIKTTIPNLFLSPIGFRIETQAASLKEFGAKISTRFSQKIKQLKNQPVMALQPGRSLVSDMGVAVTRIKVVKSKWIFLDISTASLPESLFFAQREIFFPKNIKNKQPAYYHIAGCGLSSADNFGLNIKICQPKVGDLAIILDAGAYSISRANRFTILNPPVYLINKNRQIKLIRRAENYEDIIAPMRV